MQKLQKVIFLLFLSLSVNLQSQEKAFEVVVKGQGEPILLFPGFTCTGAVWDDTVRELSKTYECHIFTFAGFGGVAPIEKPWLPKIKQAITDYVTEKELKDPVIIGHSLGGTLGLWLASEGEHGYSKVIVVDALASTGALMMPNFKSEDMVYDNPFNNQLLSMDEVAFSKMADQMAAGMSLNKGKQAQIRDWMVMSDRETYVYGYTDLLRLDLRESVANITIPVIILAATHPYGEEMAKNTYTEQYKNLTDYELLFAENSAHFIMYDRPEWFLNTLKEKLQ
ncbi:alpha/beta hydrolase [Flavobacteriaceae bacterium TP-CH-4]|uniref:Alpha/beta hydrolase n=1 Tax=Pelagihabitans pacificus TaxID=2696054 RepID=A0A967AYY8_9FLAO|nr:alpha/beta hydrolase [Pelagihabitans pacificus]NHF59126.1 alpha/beta hydrolase [Pelagihabitans pacificus]